MITLMVKCSRRFTHSGDGRFLKRDNRLSRTIFLPENVDKSRPSHPAFLAECGIGFNFFPILIGAESTGIRLWCFTHTPAFVGIPPVVPYLVFAFIGNDLNGKLLLQRNFTGTGTTMLQVP